MPSNSSLATQCRSSATPWASAPCFNASTTGEVGVGKIDVLADECDRDLFRRTIDAIRHRTQALTSGGGTLIPSLRHHDIVETAGVEEDRRDLIDVGDIRGIDHRGHWDVTEETDLAPFGLVDGTIRTDHDGVWLDTPVAKLGNAVLGRLRLHFLGRPDIRGERHVDEDGRIVSDIVAQLPNGLEERQDLDVSDGATDLRDDNIGPVRVRDA